MNLKRITTAILATAAIVIGGATTAEAASVVSYRSPGSNGCGALVDVTTYQNVAIFSYKTCDHESFGQTAAKRGTYKAPSAAAREGCGALLNFTVFANGGGLFRYAECDIPATRGATKA